MSNQVKAIRAIDKVGRLVIPKDIRSCLELSPGDSLEIKAADNAIVISKYKTMNLLGSLVDYIAEAIGVTTNLSIIICNTEEVISSFGISLSNILNSTICKDVIKLKSLYDANTAAKWIYPIEDCGLVAKYIQPIVADGSTIGAICAIEPPASRTISAEKHSASVSKIILDSYAKLIEAYLTEEEY